jgi:hypothetical protein
MSAPEQNARRLHCHLAAASVTSNTLLHEGHKSRCDQHYSTHSHQFINLGSYLERKNLLLLLLLLLSPNHSVNNT